MYSSFRLLPFIGMPGGPGAQGFMRLSLPVLSWQVV